MSFFGKMFGGKKGEKAPTTGEAIQKLRETEDMLIKKQEFLESKIEQELQIARTNGVKNKRAALQALKRKKRYEKQLQQIDGTLSTIEMQREALEGANTNTAVLTTMKNAADALKAAHKHMDVDQVHDMMDDIAEQQDVAREISDAISNPVAFGQDVDEDDLLKELEELEQEELDKELLGVATPTPELPNVPVGEPSKVKGKASSPRKNPSPRGSIEGLYRSNFNSLGLSCRGGTCDHPINPHNNMKNMNEKADDDDDMKELEAWAS